MLISSPHTEQTPASSTAGPLLRQHQTGAPTATATSTSTSTTISKSARRTSKPVPSQPLRRNANLDQQLREQETRLQQQSSYTKFLQRRRVLPAYQQRDRILQTITENQVVVIGGETGCGKTTQVPQFVLESLLANGQGSLCNIVCTQPRRLSATAVAERVATERSEKIGASVGYNIRLEKRSSKDTRLLFCTTGILLRQLQADPELKGVSHVFVDEVGGKSGREKKGFVSVLPVAQVHERSLDNDVLLALLKDLRLRRKDVKVWEA